MDGAIGSDPFPAPSELFPPGFIFRNRFLFFLCPLWLRAGRGALNPLSHPRMGELRNSIPDPLGRVPIVRWIEHSLKENKPQQSSAMFPPG